MLQKAWFSGQKWIWLLSPLSLIFYVLSATRRYFFRRGFIKSQSSTLPVIVVGNISVGGNGKTPLTISLVSELRAKGYTPAVLSRGYGGSQTVFPYNVTPNCSAELVGDEPSLLAKRLKVDVIIDPVRMRGAHFIEQSTQADIIICDDGLQHYALKRDIELCVMDKRGLGNGYLLPMGPLREGAWRLSTIDACIVNIGFSEQLTTPITGLSADKQFNMRLLPAMWVNVKTGQKMTVTEFKSNSNPVLAMAGIGDPNRFFDTLKDMKIKINECKAYADHAVYKKADIPASMRVLMTEKDAVKCGGFAHDDCWYLQIDAQLPETFLTLIEQKLQGSGKLKSTVLSKQV